jgi:hypothetical protein
MNGGTGDDLYYVNNVGDVAAEVASGVDQVISTITHTLSTNLENLTLSGAANINGTGNAKNNIIIGNSGNNTLSGLDGNDTLKGAGGSIRCSAATAPTRWMAARRRRHGRRPGQRHLHRRQCRRRCRRGRRRHRPREGLGQRTRCRPISRT